MIPLWEKAQTYYVNTHARARTYAHIYTHKCEYGACTHFFQNGNLGAWKILLRGIPSLSLGLFCQHGQTWLCYICTTYQFSSFLAERKSSLLPVLVLVYQWERSTALFAIELQGQVSHASVVLDIKQPPDTVAFGQLIDGHKDKIVWKLLIEEVPSRKKIMFATSV